MGFACVLLNVQMMDLIWGRQWCSSVRPIPASVSSLLLCSSCPCSSRGSSCHLGAFCYSTMGCDKLPRSLCFLLILTALIPVVTSLPCLLDTSKQPCYSGRMPFTHRLYGSVLLFPLEGLMQIWVGEDDDNLSTHPGIFQMLPPF